MADAKPTGRIKLTGERLEIYRRNRRIKLLILCLPLVGIVVANIRYAHDLHAASVLVGQILVATIVLHVFFTIYTIAGKETPQYLRQQERTQQKGMPHGNR